MVKSKNRNYFENIENGNADFQAINTRRLTEESLNNTTSENSLSGKKRKEKEERGRHRQSFEQFLVTASLDDLKQLSDQLAADIENYEIDLQQTEVNLQQCNQDILACNNRLSGINELRNDETFTLQTDRLGNLQNRQTQINESLEEAEEHSLALYDTGQSNFATCFPITTTDENGNTQVSMAAEHRRFVYIDKESYDHDGSINLYTIGLDGEKIPVSKATAFEDPDKLFLVEGEDVVMTARLNEEGDGYTLDTRTMSEQEIEMVTEAKEAMAFDYGNAADDADILEDYDDVLDVDINQLSPVGLLMHQTEVNFEITQTELKISHMLASKGLYLDPDQKITPDILDLFEAEEREKLEALNERKTNLESHKTKTEDKLDEAINQKGLVDDEIEARESTLGQNVVAENETGNETDEVSTLELAPNYDEQLNATLTEALDLAAANNGILPRAQLDVLIMDSGLSDGQVTHLLRQIENNSDLRIVPDPRLSQPDQETDLAQNGNRLNLSNSFNRATAPNQAPTVAAPTLDNTNEFDLQEIELKLGLNSIGKMS